MDAFPNTEETAKKQRRLRVAFAAALRTLLSLAVIFFLFVQNADPALRDEGLLVRAGTGGARFFATLRTAFDRTFLHAPRFLAQIPLDARDPIRAPISTTSTAQPTPLKPTRPAAPSASKRNIALAPPFITEVCAGTDAGSNDEFVELYNPNDSAFDLTGWSLKKRSSTGNETTLVPASRLKRKIIAPKGYFLLGNAGGYAGAVPADVLWAKSNTLGRARNAVILYNDLDAPADEAAWEDLPTGQSIGRRSADEAFQIQIPEPENSERRRSK